jgi:hypothetical protein
MLHLDTIKRYENIIVPNQSVPIDIQKRFYNNLLPAFYKIINENN